MKNIFKPGIKLLIVVVTMLSIISVQTLPVFAAKTSAYKGDCTGADLSQDCGIYNMLTTSIKILSGLVGVVVVAMIIVGGIQYALARDNPQAVSAAKQKIINAVLALVAYLSIFAFLQWLVPGGII